MDPILKELATAVARACELASMGYIALGAGEAVNWFLERDLEEAREGAEALPEPGGAGTPRA